MYAFKAKVNRVIDGDTIDFDLDLGFYMTKTVRIRLRDFDAPELRGNERLEGIKVRNVVVDVLSEAKEITVITYKDRSFDRWMGDVFCDGDDIRELI